ncbi:MAG: hypothetical protein JEZ00_10455 [Anaerolineaceae bacterium]|nr:hypothetical protein [Anaerolineaceae bacterium]
MKRKRQLMFILSLSTILTVGIVFRTFILVNIIEPTALLFWAVWRVLISVNQNIYWQTLIWGSIFLLLRFMPNKTVNQTAYTEKANSKEIKGTTFWKSLLYEAAGNPAKEDALRFELEKLMLFGLAQQERSSMDEVKKRMQQYEYDFPDFVYRYFLPPAFTWKNRFARLVKSISHTLPIWIRQLWVSHEQQKIHQMLTWLQKTLEVPYEGSAYKNDSPF